MLVFLVMLTGLFLTLIPRVPGTIIIFVGALIYGAFNGLDSVSPQIWLVLLAIIVIAEIIGAWLRVILTRKIIMSRSASVNSFVTNFAGILVSDALLGPHLGLLLWESIAGPILESHTRSVAGTMLRLTAVASWRFGCGLAMIVIIIVYFFH